MTYLKESINKITITLFASLFVFDASAGSADDKYSRSNEKYNCSPGELATYMGGVTKAASVRPHVTTADEHIESEIAKEAAKGKDSCLVTIKDPEIMKKINKLIDQMQNLSFSAPSVPMDAIKAAIMKQVASLMKIDVCGVVTEQFAKLRIKEFVDNKYDLDIDGMAANFKDRESIKSYATGAATEKVTSIGKDTLTENGLSTKWIDEDDGWKGAGTSLAKKEAVEQMGSASDLLFK